MSERCALFLALVIAASSPALQAATLVVTTDADSLSADGACSLREAILAANTDQPQLDCPAGSGADRIEFSLAAATIELTDHLPLITGPLHIAGPGADLLAVDGNDSFRPIILDSPGNDALLIVEDLTLTRGYSGASANGGAVFILARESAVFRRVHFVANRAANAGGAVHVLHTNLEPEPVTFLTLQDCLLTGNRAEGPGGGGALSASTVSEVRIFGSTFVDNRAEDSSGGAIRCNRCSLHVERTTLSANQAEGSGGAISVLSNAGIGSAFTLRHATVFDNTAGTGAGSQGGGIHLKGTEPLLLTVENSVIADNEDLDPPETPDVFCDPIVSLAATEYTLIGVDEGCQAHFPAGSPNADFNFVGSALAPLSAGLGPLGDHGGNTPVHLPLLSPVSPLIDQGHCPEERGDQRGYGDPVAATRTVELNQVPTFFLGCDIGAVELEAQPYPELDFADGFESGNTSMWSNAVG